jgi:hypothetical protein
MAEKGREIRDLLGKISKHVNTRHTNKTYCVQGYIFEIILSN